MPDADANAASYSRVDSPHDSGDVRTTAISSRFSSFLHRCLYYVQPWRWNSLMGWPLLLAYFILTFAQELPTTAIGVLLTNELHYEPDETNQYYAATYVPWTIRPVYAFLSDQLPILKYRRRPYFVLSAIGACVTQVCLALFGHTKSSFLVLAIATQVFIAFSEVACDSLTVEWANDIAARIAKVQSQMKLNQTESVGDMKGSSSPQSDARSSEPLLSPEPVSSSPITAYGALPTESNSVTLRHVSFVTTASRHVDPRVNSSDLNSASGGVRGASSADEMTERVVNRIIATTPDPLRITPLLVKSRIQSECTTIRSTGSLAAAAVSIVVLLYFEPRTLVLWSSFSFLFGIGAIVCYAQERKVESGYFFLSRLPENYDSYPQPGSPDFAAPASDILLMPLSRWLFLYRKAMDLLKLTRVLFGPLLFIFIVNMVPNSDDAYGNYTMSDYSQFMNWQFGLFQFVSLSGSLVGCIFYQQVVATSSLNIQLVFVVMTIAASAFGCTEILLATKSNGALLMNDQTFIIIDNFVVSAVGILSQMPPIILAAHYAKGLGLEASMFSLFAASAHLGSLASNEISAFITRQLGIQQKHWQHLWQLILICNLVALVPLVLMPMLLFESETPLLSSKAPVPTTQAEVSGKAANRESFVHI